MASGLSSVIRRVVSALLNFLFQGGGGQKGDRRFGGAPPSKRVMQALWRRGVQDEAAMRNAMQKLGCDMSDSYFNTVMRRLRKTGSADSPRRSVREDLDEVLDEIDRRLDDLGIPDRR